MSRKKRSVPPATDDSLHQTSTKASIDRTASTFTVNHAITKNTKHTSPNRKFVRRSKNGIGRISSDPRYVKKPRTEHESTPSDLIVERYV
jgi:hypothetical protein